MPGVAGPATATRVMADRLGRERMKHVEYGVGAVVSSLAAKAPMAQYVYTMRRVGKVVPPKRFILKNISLNFFAGAKIGVLGLNGSGKSTLLNIMAGVDKDYDGEVVAKPNMRIGYLPQEPQLYADKSVREAVEEGLGEVFGAKKRLDEVYASYAEPDADFDKLAKIGRAHV